ncbi:LLM class flavin-dependent oxidoreductase [Phytoactinopolyspora sp. XMNu-373]|uniref:LLM class flavin-dependent oxidoreductase n=2 Tax=Phytoactinopolyspora mesophila TaxID=2650750 RepID=A0A7K3M9J0_9ACTN|nr:LLM class flavin-dependent oxidoreductase [Phytoactinopolyspora mesophila]
MCFDRTFPAALVTDFARRLDHGADQLWVIEDCFYTAGVSLAASALSVSERLTVGIGILPAVARTSAVTAMEIATLCNLAPGRVLPGIGHGVQSWMAQMGVRPSSPVRTLEEVMVAVRRLLAGERVTMHGEHVYLDDVQLYHPPDPVPPLLAGVRGPKSLAMAGRVAGGVVLAEPAGPSYVRWAREQAGHPDPFHVAVFSVICVQQERRSAYRTMAPWLAGLLDDPSPGIRALPFCDDLLARFAQHGVDGLVTMPPDWWTELAPIGTMDDAMQHIEALEAAGVHSIGMYPAPDPDIAKHDLEDVITLASR